MIIYIHMYRVGDTFDREEGVQGECVRQIYPTGRSDQDKEQDKSQS